VPYIIIRKSRYYASISLKIKGLAGEFEGRAGPLAKTLRLSPQETFATISL